MAKQFYIIDGSAYMYRAFYAIRELSNAAGLPTNATYGFTKTLLKIINEKKPDYLVIAFDARGPTFRHEIYEAYKAHRPPMPEALSQQVPYIHKMVEAFQIPMFQEKGLEADDFIGTLAKKGEAAGLEVVIVSGDKDMYQLITPKVTMYDISKGIVITEESVQEKFGIRPDQIIEMMGLMGDAADAIPGVAGIGKKTAMQLIQTYSSIEALLNRLDEVKRPKLKKSLEAEGEIARLSRELARIKIDCPLNFKLKNFEVQSPDAEKLRPLFQELEFSALLKELLPAPKAPALSYEIVDVTGILNFITQVQKEGEVAFRLKMTEAVPMDREALGIALAASSGKIVYFALSKTDELLTVLKSLFESKMLIFGHGLKASLSLLKRNHISYQAKLFDVEIADYLINPSRRDHSLEGLSLEYLKEQMNTEQANLFSENDFSPETIAPMLCREADQILRLSKHLIPQLESQSLTRLFEEMEMPLVAVLSEIEAVGVKIDLPHLAEMSTELEIKLSALKEKIYELAEGEFNINSPKQLAEILFNRLGLTPIKKTKTGFSTNEEVLTRLSSVHPLPAEILNSRQMTKLKSTYIDALPKLVHPLTGRVHTQLKQTVAATGRLSSTDPNLQNIPIRGEMGLRIRQAFIAEPGNFILSADYNQIELRILAHLSADPVLIQAFQDGVDVHTQTAIEIFGLSKDEISQEMRRVAKSVNFGIIYGISPFGLSNNIGVTLKEAKRYIDLYFEHYQGVKTFFEANLKEATEKGYVTTIFNRRRQIKELSSTNAFTRGVGERLAMNTPIQGSAADIIKVAMINVWRWMRDENLKAKMTLQVHDELLFDVPEEEVDLMKEKVSELMENAVKLKVPLTVDVGVGKNWAEAH